MRCHHHVWTCILQVVNFSLSLTRSSISDRRFVWKIVDWTSSPACSESAPSPCRSLYEFYYRVFQFIEQLLYETEDIIIFRSLFATFSRSLPTPNRYYNKFSMEKWQSEKRLTWKIWKFLFYKENSFLFTKFLYLLNIQFSYRLK